MDGTKPKLTKGMFTSRTEEWATPQYVFDWLDKQFHFTLDVCATDSNSKCDNYITKEENGLTTDWGAEICFMNPPYGREIYKWMHKAMESAKKGATVICLVPARTDTKWFHETAMNADEIWFIKGRLKFGNGKQSAPFPSCIIIFKPGQRDSVPTIKSITIN